MRLMGWEIAEMVAHRRQAREYWDEQWARRELGYAPLQRKYVNGYNRFTWDYLGPSWRVPAKLEPIPPWD